MRWPVGPRADGEQNGSAGDVHDFTVVLHHLHRVGIDEACRAANVLHAVAGELVFQHLDLVVERDQQAAAQIVRVDLLLDAVGAAIKPRSRQPVRLSAVSRNVLEGMVPVCTETPPTRLPFSMTRTLFSSLAARMAARLPAGPLPITIRSNWYMKTPEQNVLQ